MTAPAVELLPVPDDGSCFVHPHHGPAQPIYLQAHHIFPKYLQYRVYGDHTVRDDRTAPVCGTGHDTIHHFIDGFDVDVLVPRITVPREFSAYREEWSLAVTGWHRYLLAKEGATAT